MGQKVNPHGMRVGVIKDWDSRWYASNEKVGDLLVEDKKIRDYLKKTLYNAQVPKIEIERQQRRRDHLPALRPSRHGHRQGRQGHRGDPPGVEKMIGKPVKLNIVEVRNPDMNAQLVAENIAAAAGEAHQPPPGHEERHGPRHARRRQGHQVRLRRPPGRP